MSQRPVVVLVSGVDLLKKKQMYAFLGEPLKKPTKIKQEKRPVVQEHNIEVHDREDLL